MCFVHQAMEVVHAKLLLHSHRHTDNARADCMMMQ